jgi:hypothetical protein
MVLRHVLERLDALEASDKIDAEAWASVRRASCDHRRRLLNLEAAQQQPAGHIRDATEMVGTPKAAPVATDDEIRKVYDDAYDNSTDPGFVSTLRAVYDLGRQHGAAQPPAAQPAPPAAPVGGLVERVAAEMTGDDDPSIDARLAICEVAVWLDLHGQHGCSVLLREKADR